MRNPLKDHVLVACRRLMRPIVLILIRNGVMHREFSELCKSVYVEMASRDFGLQGRPTNVSRMALLTGLDRKEIKRVKDAMKEAKPVARRNQDRLSRVLSGWYQDPDFATAKGKPRKLKPEGKGATFATLCRRYGGDVPAVTLLRELKRVGAVAETSSGQVAARHRYYMPFPSDPYALQRAGRLLEDLGTTIHHNLYRDKGSPSRFEGHATNKRIPSGHIAAFRGFVEKEGQKFLEVIDLWLSQHESAADAGTSSDHVRLGLGVYWIEEALQGESTP